MQLAQRLAARVPSRCVPLLPQFLLGRWWGRPQSGDKVASILFHGTMNGQQDLLSIVPVFLWARHTNHTECKKSHIWEKVRG